MGSKARTKKHMISTTRIKKDKVPRKTQEFVCSTCGYEAYKKAGYAHCPLCLICKGCKRKVRACSCMEGE